MMIYIQDNFGFVIVQLSKELVEGQILCDSKGTRVAKVMELIGPIKKIGRAHV